LLQEISCNFFFKLHGEKKTNTKENMKSCKQATFNPVLQVKIKLTTDTRRKSERNHSRSIIFFTSPTAARESTRHQ
jgi:hypothetical protein